MGPDLTGHWRFTTSPRITIMSKDTTLKCTNNNTTMDTGTTFTTTLMVTMSTRWTPKPVPLQKDKASTSYALSYVWFLSSGSAMTRCAGRWGMRHKSRSKSKKGRPRVRTMTRGHPLMIPVLLSIMFKKNWLNQIMNYLKQLKIQKSRICTRKLFRWSAPPSAAHSAS